MAISIQASREIILGQQLVLSGHVTLSLERQLGIQGNYDQQRNLGYMGDTVKLYATKQHSP